MKKALIVVDYQKDFVDGALGFPGAEKLDSRIADKIREYHANQDTVVFTFDTHTTEYEKTWEGTHLPVPHCLRETEGWALYGETAKECLPEDILIEKPVFGSLELGEYLRRQEFAQVELVGLVSHICVLFNAIVAKTALPEAEIIVDAACTDSFDPTLQEKALDLLEANYITVTNRTKA